MGTKLASDVPTRLQRCHSVHRHNAGQETFHRTRRRILRTEKATREAVVAKHQSIA